MNQYVYVPTKWKDQIIEVDEFGHVVYEKDDIGKIVYWKDNLGNYVLDPVTKQPIPKPKLFQEGTRHTAPRENNQEEGISKSHQRLDSHDNDLMRMKVQMELDGRAPGNSGTFADTFDGEPNKLIRQTAVAVLTAPRSAGTSVLNVDTTDGFKPFTEVTVYDGTNSEDVLITDVTASTITVQPLDNDYVKGARVSRSNTRIADVQMTAGDWGTYSVAVMEVV